MGAEEVGQRGLAMLERSSPQKIPMTVLLLGAELEVGLSSKDYDPVVRWKALQGTAMMRYYFIEELEVLYRS